MESENRYKIILSSQDQDVAKFLGVDKYVLKTIQDAEDAVEEIIKYCRVREKPKIYLIDQAISDFDKSSNCLSDTIPSVTCVVKIAILSMKPQDELWEPLEIRSLVDVEARHDSWEFWCGLIKKQIGGIVVDSDAKIKFYSSLIHDSRVDVDIKYDSQGMMEPYEVYRDFPRMSKAGGDMFSFHFEIINRPSSKYCMIEGRLDVRYVKDE